MAAIRSATVGKVPRCRAWRVMTEKNASTKFSQEPEVGVKCRRTRRCRASQARTAGCLCVVRVGADGLLQQSVEQHSPGSGSCAVDGAFSALVPCRLHAS